MQSQIQAHSRQFQPFLWEKPLKISPKIGSEWEENYSCTKAVAAMTSLSYNCLAAPTGTPTAPIETPTPIPCPTPAFQWLEEDFTIAHYTFALESDPIYANDTRVSVNGLPPDRLSRDGFLFGARGILLQGTGLAEGGSYITIDWNKGWPNGKNTYFVYGIGGSNGTPVAWQTAATGDPRLPFGTRIAIEIYPGGVFTINDTGGGVGTNHIDAFVGAITIAEADQLGTRTSRVAILP